MSQTTSPQIRATAKELDLRLKNVDEDQWLASRYAAKPVRKRLVAFYCLIHELERALTMSEPMLGHIRIQWWREIVEQIYSGNQVRSHDLALALKDELGQLEYIKNSLWEVLDVYDKVLEMGSEDQASRIEASACVSIAAAKLIRPELGEHSDIVGDCGRAAIAARLTSNSLASSYDRVRRDFREIPLEFGAVINQVALVPYYAKSASLNGVQKRWIIFKAVLLGKVEAMS